MRQHSTAQHSTAQHSTAQHSTAQHSLRHARKLLLTPLLFCLPFTAAYAELDSSVKFANCWIINGWAYDPSNPGKRFKLDIIDTSTASPTKIATVNAQALRQDLLAAGKGDGKYGFYYQFPASIRNAQHHTFAVRLSGTNTDLANSPQTTDFPCYGRLNDTGITSCSDNTSDGLACPAPGFIGQDGDYGRDAKNGLRKIGKGSAGFDFTKIANDGSALPASAVLGSAPKDWACTRDNVTGLVWEVKTDDGGLRDKDNTYTWYDSDAYAKQINSQNLCGKTGWRLPKLAELISIVDYGHIGQAIDAGYFPNTSDGGSWSSSSDVNGSDAGVVNFYGGYVGRDRKYLYGPVRLVRSGQ